MPLRTVPHDTGRRMKKLLLFTYYWPPAGGAGVQRWLGFAPYLPKNGWEPLVVTADPKYATYPQRDESLEARVPEEMHVVRTKSLEPLQWYGRLVGKERIPYGGFSNEKGSSAPAKFIRGNFFIPDARRGWNRYALRAAHKLIRDLSPELMVTTGPPHSTHLIGAELKRKYGLPWVADMRDPWTEVYYNLAMPRTNLAVRYDRSLERKVLTDADAVITASPGFAEQFSRNVKRKYHTVTNGFDGFIPRKAKPVGAPFYITYAGTVAESYRPQALFRALAGLDPAAYRLRIAGSIAPEVAEMIRAAGIADNLDYLGYLPHDRLRDELACANLTVLLSPDTPGGEAIIPGKLFEYLSTGRPVAALLPSGSAAASILRSTGAGQAFTHGDADGLRVYIAAVMAGTVEMPDAEKAGRYRREALARQLVGIFNGVAR